MADLREFTFPSADGVHQVHAVEWLPGEGRAGLGGVGMTDDGPQAGPKPKAVLQLVHGISEYIMRYDAFARFLAEHGVAVVGSDHLGHGSTARGPEEYGFLAQQDGWDYLARDVRSLRVKMGEQYPGIPYFLLGHSMGSFVARTYLIRWPGTLSGCILSGTGQQPDALISLGGTLAGLLARIKGPKNRSKLLTNMSTGAYNKAFAPNRTGADWISRDTAVVDAYMADPLCRFSPTIGMFRDMMGGLKAISNKENLARMDPSTPVYLFSGDKDPVGEMGAGVRKVYGFFKDAGVKDLTMKLYPDGRHEMLNEPERETVYADVLAWIERRI